MICRQPYAARTGPVDSRSMIRVASSTRSASMLLALEQPEE
jgi:hypothetical protein